MKKYLTLAFLASFVSAVAFAGAFPATVTIDAAKNKQPAVTFPHEKHATTLVKTCDTCHHTQKGLTKATAKDVAKCSSCHMNAKAGVPSMAEMGMQKNPFHSLCINCHKTEKKGPSMCKDCHKKS